YIGIAVIILIMNATEIPSVLKLIVENAFGFKEVAGGTLGGALLLGIKRGLFSNEAGMGSAPNAAATANVTHPVKQGLIQTLGVFTDTLIICSCTAFIILLSGVDYSGPNASTGIKLTQDALSSQIGPFGNTFIAICILLFAFSSIVGNYYYGESNIEFLNDKKWFLFAYRVCVILMVLFGSVAKVDVVWNLADVFMGLMAIVNLVAIFMLSKYAFLALKDYTEQKKSGIKEPIFKASSIPGLKNAKEWE
ncbi:alanine:cation symporter family protein, partial [Clostridium baratii]|uniref:alanine:cation symporter family protein n=1 Tax=Clostridium baratii TaxID=1561 RepID=UPI002A7580B6